jgi:hypothetical protein
LRADQLNELFRQQRPRKFSNGGYPLHPKFCVLNFELPGQFKKNNLPRTPYETYKSLVKEVFLAEYVIFTCKNYPPPSLPPKNCRKKAKFCKLTFYTCNIKKTKKNATGELVATVLW